MLSHFWPMQMREALNPFECVGHLHIEQSLSFPSLLAVMDVLWEELDCEACAVIKRLSYWTGFVYLFFYMSLSERHIGGSGKNLRVPSFILATQTTLSPGLKFYPFCHQYFSISTRDLVDLRIYLNCETLRIGPWTWFLPSGHKKWGTPSRFLLSLLNIHAR